MPQKRPSEHDEGARALRNASQVAADCRLEVARAESEYGAGAVQALDARRALAAAERERFAQTLYGKA